MIGTNKYLINSCTAYMLPKDFANLYEIIKSNHSSSNVARIHKMVSEKAN